MTGGLFDIGSRSPAFSRFVRLGAVRRCIDDARSDLSTNGGEERERKLNILLFTERRIKSELALENIEHALRVPA